MVLSNEPGYYKKGKYGIRIENLVYVKKVNNELFFENLTLAPIDKDLINFNELNKDEKNSIDFVNKYITSGNVKAFNKNKVFIGSNSSLVAPITIHENSIVGAGSVITRNVKKKSLALTRAEQSEKKNYK